jgi:hypothetical protein
MKAFLTRLLFGSPARTIEHPIFGKATLVETKSGAYWEAEPELDGETIGVGIDTVSGEEPTTEQVRFYREITRDLTAAFARAAPAIATRYEEWERKPLPTDWRTVFKFAGLSVPMNGDDKRKWDIAFDCVAGRANGHMFTCYFENGSPVGASVDG